MKVDNCRFDLDRLDAHKYLNVLHSAKALFESPDALLTRGSMKITDASE